MNSTVLKIFIAFFLIVITVGLFTKKNISPQQKYPIFQSKPTVYPTAVKAFSFNLKGPFVCQMKEKEATISAYVKNERIFVKKGNAQNFLLREDCLYLWETGKYSGERICGLSQYLGIVRQISQFSGFIDKFAQGSQLSEQKESIKTLLNACRKEEIKDEKLFEFPKNILFRNKELNSLIR